MVSEEMFKNVDVRRTNDGLDKGNKMTFTSGTHVFSCTNYLY